MVKLLSQMKVFFFCLQWSVIEITLWPEIASFSNLPSVNYVGEHLKQNYSPLASPLRIRTVEESLLHKKLCKSLTFMFLFDEIIRTISIHLGERNLSLWNNLNSFIQSTVSSTSKRLIATDQLLVQSQVTLQTAAKTIKKMNETTAEVTDRFKSIVSGNFIPPITLSWFGIKISYFVQRCDIQIEIHTQIHYFEKLAWCSKFWLCLPMKE